MSVRKRSWKTNQGEMRESWVVDYVDQLGQRHLKTFARKRDADTHHAKVAVEVRAGIHTADSQSITVAEAGKLWLTSREAAGVERATLVNYAHYVAGHITPLIGATKLSALTVPFVRSFTDRLRAEGRSPTMVSRLTKVLSSILSDAQERGLVAQNVARGLRSPGLEGRRRTRLEAGRDIPTARGDSAHHWSSGGLGAPALAPSPSRGDLHRAACLRTQRATLERCGFR
jgi:hypothetical protein